MNESSCIMPSATPAAMSQLIGLHGPIQPILHAGIVLCRYLRSSLSHSVVLPCLREILQTG
ncbi:hypothetical protein K470DRAFT_135258 [Piedraia hortae CBS 480.64]|uniref:Uncharacterized protein n=1 Tax=Piedraia hortae CBS 480.64 TaxID=1314780 RepID=A0A6A7BV32_9PEZI|nr:hypothetical protein K470DRAFT_135258 [Piedraia hortae CBS 480.64]